jgi:hypothetical protein
MMGGLGSTRWAWTSTKNAVESSRSLDINRLNRAGYLQSSYRATLEWEAGWRANRLDPVSASR